MNDQSQFLIRLKQLDHASAADALKSLDDAQIAEVLQQLGHAKAVEVLEEFPAVRRTMIASHAARSLGAQWLAGQKFPEGTVGRLMEAPPAVFSGHAAIKYVMSTLEQAVKQKLISYVLVVDSEGVLVGVVTFREMLFAPENATLQDVMITDPYRLSPSTMLVDALREVVTRHFPSYPVCTDDGKLVGHVRGNVLFEAQTFEISAQAGSMVGVEKEERLATPWKRSLKSRHPWLQLNLFTAFAAAAVVGFYQEIVDKIVLLAVFLPVLSGQCSNTGCQALAVTLRGITLGELKNNSQRAILIKEGILGLTNGALTGFIAGIGMYILATLQSNQNAVLLGLITFVAMLASCLISGLAGAAVPLTLRRMGADPVTASSIFLTTATDIVSMGFFLGLAAWLLI